ncbi:MAG: hypothetical protein AAF532_07710 [Planctomycetota bacterium]
MDTDNEREASSACGTYGKLVDREVVTPDGQKYHIRMPRFLWALYDHLLEREAATVDDVVGYAETVVIDKHYEFADAFCHSVLVNAIDAGPLLSGSPLSSLAGLRYS